ncbi:LIM domain only protein 7-like isoform X2 [Oncorhynchus keta]|uniref:LIM domain only protein 7-like isoform X2 n=1 Tax=Oncorhynchus keta TaxID=8018 RepID=UPI00227BE319|nr:LIM domain only protein 7-like isoform X2 [Oncorhynchus keta]
MLRVSLFWFSVPSSCMSATSMKSDRSMDSPRYFKEREKVSQPKAEPGEPCDICSERRAMKLCLTCSVYYCEKHMRKHFIIQALRRHVMVDVTEEVVLQRNTSEKKRREEQEEEGRRQGQEEGLRWQTRKEDFREEERGHQEAAEQQCREKESEREREKESEREREKQQLSIWDSYGCTDQVQPETSRVDRAKSKSIPELDHVEEPEITVTSSDRLGEASWIKGQQTLPKVQLETQQILPKVQLETQQILPKVQLETQQILPKVQLETQQNLPKVQLERQQNLPKVQLETQQILPKVQLETQQILPKEQLERQQNLPKVQLERQQNLPKVQLERQQNLPKEQLERQQNLPKVQLETQQILQMKKKVRLRNDDSWIRQRSTSKPPATGPIRKGKSLDNLDICSSWHSSWTPESTSSILNYSWPHSGLNSYIGRVGGHSGSATMSSLSMSSLRGAGIGSNQSSWSQHSPSPSSSSSSPSPSTGPKSQSFLSVHESSRTVSGKEMCTLCDTALVEGAAMVIESLGLVYHLTCFKCINCKSELLGASEVGAEVRIRNRRLFCDSCYVIEKWTVNLREKRVKRFSEVKARCTSSVVS